MCTLAAATPLFHLLHAISLVLVSYSYQRCHGSPLPATLLFLAGSLQLVVSTAVSQVHKWQRHPGSSRSLSGSRSETSGVLTAPSAKTFIQSAWQASLPGFCCFLSSNLSFYALQWLPLHSYALLASLQVITTAVLAGPVLHSRQSRWGLLLLLAAVCTGQAATMHSASRPAAAAAGAAARASAYSRAPPGAAAVGSWQRRQQHQSLSDMTGTWLPGLAAMVAVAALSAVASVHTERLLSSLALTHRHAADEQLSSASLSCWSVALNGLCMLYWQHSSSSSSSSSSSASHTLSAVPAAAAAAAAGVRTAWGCSTEVAAPAAELDASSMGPVHWAVVCLLAVSGLFVGVVDVASRRHSSMHTACAGSLALLLLAVAASPLLQPPQQQPPLLFFACCCLATAAAMLLLQQHSREGAGARPLGAKQQQQLLAPQHWPNSIPIGGKRAAGASSGQTVQQQLQEELWLLKHLPWLFRAFDVGHFSSTGSAGSDGSSRSSSSSSDGGRRHSSASYKGADGDWSAGPGLSAELLWWLLGVLDRAVVAAVLLSLLLLLTGAIAAGSGGSSSSSSSGSSGQQGRFTLPASAAAAAAAAAHNTTTDVPMPPELVSMPCSNGRWLQREGFCPVVNCSLAPDCTVSDPACCAHLNLHMLVYLDQLLASRGLSEHSVVVYGTLLGAVRNRTILAHTNDVDVALSAAAITLLEQPATQLELWRHGYVFWCSDNVWRLCAHQHHPLPTFRRLMRPGQQHFLQGGPYVDAYLMRPSEPAAAAAVEAAAASFRTQAAAAAAAGLERPSMASDTQRQQQAAAATQQGPSRQGLLPAVARGFGLWGSSRRQREWQLCFSQVPVQLSGRRRVWVEGLQVVVPDNSEQLLAGTYGPRWRTPNLRPYAPSYDEDECVEAVQRLNSSLAQP